MSHYCSWVCLFSELISRFQHAPGFTAVTMLSKHYACMVHYVAVPGTLLQLLVSTYQPLIILVIIIKFHQHTFSPHRPSSLLLPAPALTATTVAAEWYTSPRFSRPAALHAAILARCGQGRFESAALRYLLASAANKQDAQLALSALGAVRSVAVARGDMAPWSDSFVKTFVWVSC
jgi:hypothetical protein